MKLRGGFNRDYAHSDPIGLTLGTSTASTFGLNGIPAGPNDAGHPADQHHRTAAARNRALAAASANRPGLAVARYAELVERQPQPEVRLRTPAHQRQLPRRPIACKGRSPVSGIYTGNVGIGVPDFLLGDVSTASFTTPTVVHNYQFGYSFFGQDTWRIRPEPDLNYGAALRTLLAAAEPSESGLEFLPGQRRHAHPGRQRRLV